MHLFKTTNNIILDGEEAQENHEGLVTREELMPSDEVDGKINLLQDILKRMIG